MFLLQDISWERCNVYFKFDKSLKGYNIYLIKKDIILKLESNNNEITFNVTNMPNGEMFDVGTWSLVIDKESISSYEEYVEMKEEELIENHVNVDSELIKRFGDVSRNFLYRAGKYAYIVNFGLRQNCTFYIKTNFMMINRKWKKFYLFNESKKITGKLKILIKRIYLVLVNFIYHFFRLFKFNKTKKNVLFLTENGDKLTGNLDTLYKSVEKTECHKMSLAFDNFIPGFIVKKIFIYLYEIYLMAISDVIFVDNYTPKLTHIKLSKKTRLVQLWHAGVGFKSVGYARFGLTGSPHPARSCHRNYTDVVVDREDLIPIYQEVFGVSKDKFKVLGMPRLDGYLSKETIEKETEMLYKKNNKFKTHKVILFSPTYRGNGSRDAYYDYSLIDLDKIYKFCRKNKFIFIIKMHPFINDPIEIEEKYHDLIFDYSNMDINKLIYVSDIMITDYSSCCYEYSLFDRPLIFYRFDKDIYEYLRPMHTVDAFTSKQDEVRDFDSLLKILDKYKNIDINDRFKHINNKENNSCREIKKIFIGDNND